MAWTTPWTHSVGGRLFEVFETNEYDSNTGSSRCERFLRDRTSGEVLKSWNGVGMALEPYDWGRWQDWLQKKYNDSLTTGRIPSKEPLTQKYIPADTQHVISTWSVGGNGISVGTYTAPADFKHAAANPPSAQAQHQEQEVALRHEFTFSYTGQEIADALTAQIDELTTSITALDSLDVTALALLYSSDATVNAQNTAERKRKELQSKVDKLVRERAPYLKAGKQFFDLDLEDIEHFKLDQDTTPREATPKRKRRSKAEMEAARAESAA